MRLDPSLGFVDGRESATNSSGGLYTGNPSLRGDFLGISPSEFGQIKVVNCLKHDRILGGRLGIDSSEDNYWTISKCNRIPKNRF